MYTGVTRKSILLELNSIDYPRSFTIDLMHCILLNITKNLMLLWHGKKLDVDKDHPGPYVLNADSASFLYNVVRTSRANIPVALGTLPSSMEYYTQFKAAEWKAFLDLYGPALMYNHIPDDAHANFCLLSEIWTRATQRSITYDDIDFIERSAIEFVREYERIYYHGDPQRMPACSINNHWLLHLADYIRDNGPACYWWSYPMERFCGWVREMATSKAHMGKSIANNQTRDEQINALRLRDYRGYIHPDRTPQHQYPSLRGPLRDPTGHVHLPLTNRLLRTFRSLVGRTVYEHDDDIRADIQYFRRCRLSDTVTVGSKASQYDTHVNRDSHYVCYLASNNLCRFGTVYGFIYAPRAHGQYMLVRPWKDIEADVHKHQIVYQRTNGGLEIVAVQRIRCLVGILTEVDRIDRRGRHTTMILGALHEVRLAGGINPADLRR
jgi:hypothetical protein